MHFSVVRLLLKILVNTFVKPKFSFKKDSFFSYLRVKKNYFLNSLILDKN